MNSNLKYIYNRNVNTLIRCVYLNDILNRLLIINIDTNIVRFFNIYLFQFFKWCVGDFGFLCERIAQWQDAILK